MNCKGVQSRLSAYIDCELTGSEMLQVRAHLFECTECAREEGELRILKSMLCSGCAPEPAPDFEDRLIRHVFAGKGLDERVQHRSGAPVRLFTAAAAAAALAFAAASFLGSDDRQDGNLAKQEIQLAGDQAYFSGMDPLMGGSVVPIAYGGQ
ncbi:MAG TPA: zf-HC2 domain-containing protein [Fimbriimonadaceae bacterium]|nr:zf-HC2 domain-containing protein [Fimbriimonadaceae bacterium]